MAEDTIYVIYYYSKNEEEEKNNTNEENTASTGKTDPEENTSNTDTTLPGTGGQGASTIIEIASKKEAKILISKILASFFGREYIKK